jgi:hypothetical protein
MEGPILRSFQDLKYLPSQGLKTRVEDVENLGRFER